jgi:hypothetical protein
MSIPVLRLEACAEQRLIASHDLTIFKPIDSVGDDCWDSARP